MPSTERASLQRWFGSATFQSGAGVVALMDYSERRLQRAAHSSPAEEAGVVTRVVENVSLYRHWEQSHRQMMRAVAMQARRGQPEREVRRCALCVVHRKAPFDFMRNHCVKGAARRRLMGALFGPNDYEQHLVREHTAFLSSTCSFICIDSMCEEILRQPAFCDALRSYQDAYTGYYRAYCESLMADRDAVAAPIKSLLPYLRYELRMIRDHLLRGTPEDSDYSQLRALYAETGDTQVLRVLPRK